MDRTVEQIAVEAILMDKSNNPTHVIIGKYKSVFGPGPVVSPGHGMTLPEVRTMMCIHLAEYGVTLKSL